MKAFVVAALATLWAGGVFAQTPAATAPERGALIVGHPDGGFAASCRNSMRR